MRMNINVDGVAGVVKSLTDPMLGRDVDAITETYTRKMANQSAENAPVLTGRLRNSLVGLVKREKLAQWSFGSDLPYARRQEYEHRSRKAFVRRAVWANQDAYAAAVAKRVGKVGR